MIDRNQLWPEFIVAKIFTSVHATKLFDSNWLNIYPCSKKVIHDNGGDFNGFEFQELILSYGVESRPTIVKKTRFNSVAERVHLTIADMIRTLNFSGDDWFTETDKALQIVSWTIISIVSTVTNYSSCQI